MGSSLANLGRWRELAFPSSLYLVGVSRSLSHHRDKGALSEHELGSAGSPGVANFYQECGARVHRLQGYGETAAVTWKEEERGRTAALEIVDGFVGCWEGSRMKVRPCGGGKGLLELRASGSRRGTSMALLLAVFLQSWRAEESCGLR